MVYFCTYLLAKTAVARLHVFLENACLKVVATLFLFKKRKGINAAVTLGKLLLPKDTN